MKPRTLTMFLSLLFSLPTMAEQADTKEPVDLRKLPPIEIKGDNIQPLSKTHWRVKVESEEAVKARCVAYSGDEAVAIDSIAIYPPFEVSEMYIREDDGEIDLVKCWITSTREQDLAKDYIQHR